MTPNLDAFNAALAEAAAIRAADPDAFASPVMVGPNEWVVARSLAEMNAYTGAAPGACPTCAGRGRALVRTIAGVMTDDCPACASGVARPLSLAA